jgi:hypothetical protein
MKLVVYLAQWRKNTYNILGGKFDGKGNSERLRYRWKKNGKIDFRGISYGDV